MRTKHFRLVTVILAVVMMFALSLTVFAGSGDAVTKDGVTAQLSTDKDEYSAGDTLNATVKVDNNSGKELNVVTTIRLASGASVVSGAASHNTTMQAGDSWVTPEGFFIKAGDLLLGDVDTGDISSVGVWVVLNMLAAVCLVALFVYGKNRKTWLSMFLCLIMAWGLLAPAGIANAAGVSGKLEVSCAVKVDGQDAKVVATVSYSDTEAVESSVKAAMRKADITPTGDVVNAGFSGGEDALANYPDDFLTDLMARVLVMEVNGQRIVHLNVELHYIGLGTTTSATFASALAEAAGASVDNIYVSHNNNHAAPAMLGEAAEAAIIEAARDAAANLVPVKIGVDTYGTDYGISRSPAFGMSHETPYDNNVTVIRFDHAETGAPVGMIFSLPIINTGFGIANGDNWDLLNCEFTGLTSRYIEEQFAGYADFTALYLNGFVGNGTVHFPETDTFYAPDFNELKANANNFGAEILNCYNAIVCESTAGAEMKTSLATYTLQKANPLQQATIDRWGNSTTGDITLNMFSVGEIAYMEMNTAPYTTIGAHLKAESPFEYLVGASFIDHGFLGYIPLAESFNNPDEAETKPWQTPFDATGEKQFLDSAMDALCKLKGVTYERTMTTLTASAEQDGKRVYTFAFAEEITPDKLVISFDQSSRLNCAENFVLEVYDKAGNKTHTIEVTGNSVNYLGFSVEDVKAATVVLTVSSTYRSEQVADIPVTVHAMNYTPVE